MPQPIYPWREYLRPWKLFTLAAGIALLVVGAVLDYAPDWDIPISFIMALLAYLTAPWSLRVLLERRWRLLPLALLFAWFTVDGCYALYWALPQSGGARADAGLELPRVVGAVRTVRAAVAVPRQPAPTGGQRRRGAQRRASLTAAWLLFLAGCIWFHPAMRAVFRRAKANKWSGG